MVSYSFIFHGEIPTFQHVLLGYINHQYRLDHHHGCWWWISGWCGHHHWNPSRSSGLRLGLSVFLMGKDREKQRISSANARFSRNLCEFIGGDLVDIYLYKRSWHKMCDSIMPYLHLSSKGLAAKITTPPTVQWFLHAEVQPSSAIVGDDLVTPHFPW